MLVGGFNPPLCCVKTLKDKTLYVRRAGRLNLPYSSRAIEVKNEKTLIEVPPCRAYKSKFTAGGKL